MTDKAIFEIYMRMMDYLEEVMGSETEIVLQDLRGTMHIVDIRNAIDKSRVVGGDVSDFAKLVMREPEKYKGVSFVTNYKGTNYNSSPEVSSRTQLILGNREEIIGMLCINTPMRPYIAMQSFLDDFIRNRTRVNIGDGIAPDGIIVDVAKIVDDGMSHINTNPADMSLEAKKALVGNLGERGIFLVRGAVGEVAGRLDVSEQTIYRYIKENQK